MKEKKSDTEGQMDYARERIRGERERGGRGDYMNAKKKERGQEGGGSYRCGGW